MGNPQPRGLSLVASRLLAYALAILLSAALAACGEGGGGGDSGAAAGGNYTVGGTVSGLTGSALVLQNNAGDDLSILSDGPYVFAAPAASNAPYSVTIMTQPLGQTCSVANGNGTVAGANIVDVDITCARNERPGGVERVERVERVEPVGQVEQVEQVERPERSAP